ncbi:MAG: hypothetical protein P8183_03715 [Anaerolineae bacterium]
MKKQVVYLMGLMILALALAACGGPTAAPTATTAPEPVVEEVSEPTAEPTEEMVVEEPTAEPMETPTEEMATAVTNAVTVSDQELSADNTVTIDSVTADVAGWLVIHAQADGAPGPVLGHAPVQAGQNSDVVVEIDPAGATETLYAMLHVDAGTSGEYEFPGADVPARDAQGNVVTPSFNLTGGMPMSSAATVMTAESGELGTYLVDADGMTLYRFTNDEANMSNCTGQCADNWPPLLVEDSASLTAGENVTGELGTIERDDGTTQVTYNGLPLYYWSGDTAPGDANGQGFNDVWFVVSPSDSASAQPAPAAEGDGEPNY